MKDYDPTAVTRLERETWDRVSDSYLDRAAKLTCHAVDLLMAFSGLASGLRGLEIGCGPGHITKMMADTGAKVTGVDLAPRMIEQAINRYPEIEFLVANAETLPFSDNMFDAVLINFSIHHFAEPEKPCREIYRVLKPSGRFVFAGPIEQFAFGAFIEGLTNHHTMEDLPHGPIYLDATREDYEKLVKHAGFRDYNVTIRQLTLSLESLDALIETGWEMCELSKLPETTQDKIRQTTVDKAAPYKTDRGYEFPDRIVVGVATK